jgi:hypothetical protein
VLRGFSYPFFPRRGLIHPSPSHSPSLANSTHQFPLGLRTSDSGFLHPAVSMLPPLDRGARLTNLSRAVQEHISYPWISLPLQISPIRAWGSPCSKPFPLRVSSHCLLQFGAKKIVPGALLLVARRSGRTQLLSASRSARATSSPTPDVCKLDSHLPTHDLVICSRIQIPGRITPELSRRPASSSVSDVRLADVHSQRAAPWRTAPTSCYPYTVHPLTQNAMCFEAFPIRSSQGAA